MQSTTPAFDAEKARDGNQPVLLLEIALEPDWSEGLSLCNRRLPGWSHEERMTLPIELEISGEFSPDGGGRPRIGNVRITLANEDDVTGAPFSDILATKSLVNREARLKQHFLDANGVPLPSGDAMPLLTGVVVLPEEALFTDQEFCLEVRDPSDAWHREIGTLVTVDAFPDAPEESIGQMLNILYGSNPKVPCLPIDVGARSTLAADIDEAATEIPLTDVRRFPGSGSIWLDEEEIPYTGKTGDRLVGATRGAEALTHDTGAPALEDQAQYTWNIAEHPCRALHGLYVRRRGGSEEDWVALGSGEYSLLIGAGPQLFNSRAEFQAAVPGWAASAYEAALGDYQSDYPQADTPLPLSEGVTYSFDRTMYVFNWVSYVRSIPNDDSGQALRITFSPGVSAFGLDVEIYRYAAPLTATISLSDGRQEVRVQTPNVTQKLFFGFTGPVTWLEISLSVPDILDNIYLYDCITGPFAGSPRTDVHIGAGVLQHAVDLQVTTSSSTFNETATDAPIGQSFPAQFTQPWPRVFSFAAHPGATQRIWTVRRGLLLTTPEGSTWTYAVGGYAATWQYPGQIPPAEWTFTGQEGAAALSISNSHGGAMIEVDAVSCEVTYPSTHTPVSTVSGRKSAETIYNLEVAADVEGYADDASGSYTGTPDALILRPADILRHVAATYLGWTVSARFDAATFAAARVAEAAAGIRLDFVLRQPVHSAELFERIRHQSMSAHLLSSEGTYKRWLYPFSRTVIKTFTEADDVIAPIRVGLTPLRELYNVVGIRYAPNADGHWGGYVEQADTVSQGMGHPPAPGYGTVNRWLQDFDLVRDATTAGVAAARWLAWLKDQVFRVTLQVPIEWIHLEPWDCVAVSSDRMPGGWAAKKYLIQSARKRLGEPEGPDTIMLVARKAPE